MTVVSCADPAILDTIAKIIDATERIRRFWCDARGWAPDKAAELLAKSRLDRQVSLAHCLKKWVEPCEPVALDGNLILAWVNVRSMIEGTLKWFLSVYERDYSLKPAIKWGKPQPLDEMMLEELRKFFDANVWSSQAKADWNAFIDEAKLYGNGIHAYKDRQLNGFAEWEAGVVKLWEFITYHEKGVPYPFQQLEHY